MYGHLNCRKMFFKKKKKKRKVLSLNVISSATGFFDKIIQHFKKILNINLLFN